MKMIYIALFCFLTTGCASNNVLTRPLHIYYPPMNMVANFYQPAKNGADIYLYLIETTGANSAGGKDIHIVWQNSSKKTIKYIYFTITPVNKVGDPIVGEISKRSSHSLKSIGPYNPWFPIVLSDFDVIAKDYGWAIYTGKADNAENAIIDIDTNNFNYYVSHIGENWKNVWYNYAFVQDIKVKAAIEYMDGTKINDAKIFFVPKVTKEVIKNR